MPFATSPCPPRPGRMRRRWGRQGRRKRWRRSAPRRGSRRRSSCGRSSNAAWPTAPTSAPGTSSERRLADWGAAPRGGGPSPPATFAERILDALDEVRDARSALETRSYPESLADIDEQVAFLIHRGFIAETPLDRLAEVPRYLEAVRGRLAKLPRNPARDLESTRTLRALWTPVRDELRALRCSGEPVDTPPRGVPVDARRAPHLALHAGDGDPLPGVGAADRAGVGGAPCAAFTQRGKRASRYRIETGRSWRVGKWGRKMGQSEISESADLIRFVQPDPKSHSDPISRPRFPGRYPVSGTRPRSRRTAIPSSSGLGHG